MGNKMKIGYFADGVWAHKALNLLLNDKSISIMFICVRYDSEDLVLKSMAKENKIDCLRSKDINSSEFRKQIKKYECDLFVSMSFNQIFKKDIINIPPKNIINCHAGKLPFYRGRNVLNWVLINDEKEFGITVHFIDEGIDTGRIILQRCYEITDEDDYSTLLEKAHLECASILYESIKLLQKGSVQTICQDEIHEVGMYCGIRKIGDEYFNWDQTSREIFNFVRALCKPGPMARCYLNGKVFSINRVEMIENAPTYKGIPGQILEKKDGIIVKTMDTTIKINEYVYDGKIRVGDRFNEKSVDNC